MRFLLFSFQVIEIQENTSKTLKGHSDYVEQVIFLPDGRLASCSHNSVKVWDRESEKELFTLSGHTGYSIYTISLLPNGWLASGSSDKTIKLWDLKERKEVKTLTGHTATIASLKVLNNGNLVSYSIDDTIKIWNPCTSDSNLLLTIKGHGNEYGGRFPCAASYQTTSWSHVLSDYVTEDSTLMSVGLERRPTRQISANWIERSSSTSRSLE